MRGDHLGTRLQTITTGYDALVETSDVIDFCIDSCDCEMGVEGRFQITSVNAGVSVTLNANTALPPWKVDGGEHYDLCYRKNSPTENYVMPLG